MLNNNLSYQANQDAQWGVLCLFLQHLPQHFVVLGGFRDQAAERIAIHFVVGHCFIKGQVGLAAAQGLLQALSLGLAQPGTMGMFLETQ